MTKVPWYYDRTLGYNSLVKETTFPFVKSMDSWSQKAKSNWDFILRDGIFKHKTLNTEHSNPGVIVGIFRNKYAEPMVRKIWN